ncbi:MAG: hypothetical protein HOV77_06945 [Hamadaea sp.]|uniref:hypothetical protein n=1 Tax=Hamadaea sp. TaxID=2024425 RepID=UPI00180F44BA|nr:hypothetical protein [Hamadaea sp.]NUT18905.1 hypothetical protein [Hamadaea sp.]
MSVRIGTDRLDAEILADGGCISSIRASGRELLLRTPWAGLDDGPPMAGSAAEWHRRYRGGWHLLLPRPLGPATVGTIAQPFHGEAAWRRWRLEPVSATGCRASVLLRTVPLSIDRAIEVRPGAVRVTTTVRNVGPAEVRFGWAEHPSFDAAIFDGGQVELDDTKVAVVPLGTGAFEDRPVATGHARILGSSGVCVELDWDVGLLGRAYVWQERRATTGFPWYAAADALAVEPASQRYDHPADELGTVTLAPAAVVTSTVTLTVHTGRY